MNESVTEILTQMRDYVTVLRGEHERRLCDVHPPVLQTKDVANALESYAQRFAAAHERVEQVVIEFPEPRWLPVTLALRLALDPEGTDA